MQEQGKTETHSHPADDAANINDLAPLTPREQRMLQRYRESPRATREKVRKLLAIRAPDG